MLRDALTLWRKTRSRAAKGTTLYLRLFAFFSLFVAAILAAVLLFLNFTGYFQTGSRKNEIWFENELDHLVQDASKDFGNLSVQGVALSEQLSHSLEVGLQKQGLSPGQLGEAGIGLEELLSDQMPVLFPALKNQKCGGAFVVLNVSVLGNEGGQRAGLFLKRTLPNAVDSIGSKIYFLRGPAFAARETGVELLGQWRMEFTAEETGFFDIAVKTARAHGELPISRLYYWTPRTVLEGNSEAGMLLTVPLVASDGTVMGVCGFEVSAMLFKQLYSPDNDTYTKVFSLLAPLQNSALHMQKGLQAGNSYLNGTLKEGNVLLPPGAGLLTQYQGEDGTRYSGVHRCLTLYPADSPYADAVWVTAVMAPSEEVAAISREGMPAFQIGLLLLCLFSICAAAFISRRYIAPVLRTLEGIKKGEDYSALPKTQYLEINDLLEFLAAQDEAANAALEDAQARAAMASRGMGPAPQVNGEQFCRFLACLKTLSPAERRVFDLYVQEYKAKEIAAALHISMNTIKYHNGNIYSKLEVSSRRELLDYIRYMRYQQKDGGES